MRIAEGSFRKSGNADYEVAVLAEHDDSTLRDFKPSIFVIVARNNDALNLVYSRFMDDNLRRKVAADTPELQQGLAKGRMATLVFVLNDTWVVPNDTGFNTAGDLNLYFLKTLSERSGCHAVVSENRGFPIRINAEFRDPFDDCPAAERHSPHPAATPEGRHYH